ncbi:hypothetical protein M3936_23360 [Sutcliffiella horikoshii]|uniref:hypothetical protein n=1 Tax=Sutcliffiella horikoshii TaxID=79883 RepID=UPI002041653C|nr:hypothetical protein [Sutcliffiella horikoshii]MCM3620497.1 hypothetical protein [Sutcliffiella horikoshii]
MKVFVSMLLTFSLLLGFNSISFGEENGEKNESDLSKIPFEELTPDQLAQRVEQDMKENPDKVEYAVPIIEDEMSTQAVYLPYPISYNFTGSTQYFRDHMASTKSGIKVNINHRTNNTLTFNLYRALGDDHEYIGSRVFFGNTNSTANMTVVPFANYHFVLTGPNGPVKSGSGAVIN